MKIQGILGLLVALMLGGVSGYIFWQNLALSLVDPERGTDLLILVIAGLIGLGALVIGLKGIADIRRAPRGFDDED